MLTVPEALQAIMREVDPLDVSRVSLADVLGLVLAEDVVSNQDSPPFDKALMDGFAVRSADVASGQAKLRVIEEVMAGLVPQKTVHSDDATQIMTGAPLPEGADAVVRVEDTTFEPETNIVTIDTQPIRPGTNMMPQGTSMKVGDRVLSAGRKLRPQELGALAELGLALVPVRSRPRIGVLATGDELVAVEETPGPGQIRNSNETMLVAQILRAGGEPVPLGIARDTRPHLRERIQAGLDCDILLLSGGVSAGKLDLVPSELERAGVKQVFHKVKVKPGKPIWFGSFESSHSKKGQRYVFGLPGNPVSSMVCFELFVRMAIHRMMGVEPAERKPIRARLTVEHTAYGDRPTYFPSRLDWSETGPSVTPVQWHGSSDLRATVEANSMTLFPAGDRHYGPDDFVDVISWE